MSFLSKIFGARQDAARTDATRIYAKLMTQSRQAVFYGEGRIPDNYDGRIDFLTLHLGIVLRQLRRFEVNGQRLSQALYDVMRDDFDIALREQGLADTGVVRRIKPMIALFYTRIKAYSEALESDAPNAQLQAALQDGLLKDADEGFAGKLATYSLEFDRALAPLSLGEIALADFDFPEFG